MDKPAEIRSCHREGTGQTGGQVCSLVIILPLWKSSIKTSQRNSLCELKYVLGRISMLKFPLFVRESTVLPSTHPRT
ncbi:hypothetical protein OS493_039819, partial [Desmophyllum pertusum]